MPFRMLKSESMKASFKLAIFLKLGKITYYDCIAGLCHHSTRTFIKSRIFRATALLVKLAKEVRRAEKRLGRSFWPRIIRHLEASMAMLLYPK